MNDDKIVRYQMHLITWSFKYLVCWIQTYYKLTVISSVGQPVKFECKITCKRYWALKKILKCKKSIRDNINNSRRIKIRYTWYQVLISYLWNKVCLLDSHYVPHFVLHLKIHFYDVYFAAPPKNNKRYYGTCKINSEHNANP